MTLLVNYITHFRKKYQSGNRGKSNVFQCFNKAKDPHTTNRKEIYKESKLEIIFLMNIHGKILNKILAYSIK